MADIEWIRARQWIISTGISMENKRMQYSEDLLEFAESLRDGVILCSIVNRMKPRCVEYRKVNNVERHEFLCKRNINLFLKACSEVFHIEEKNLFTAADLYHLLNFKVVILTLSILSNKKEATDSLRWTPFSIRNHKKKSINHEEDLYANLSDIIDERAAISDDDAAPEENIYDEVEKIYSSTIYDSLIKYKKLPQEVISAATATDVILTKRDHVINEILQTEDSYVQNLKTMVESYIPALKSHISSEDKDAIFMNIEKIFMLHLDFYRELSNKKIANTEKTDDTRRVDISAFLRYKDQFLLYAYYCTHLESARKHVSELSKSQGFRNTVEELNKKLERRFPLQQQLAVVFQRVLKYSLLLKELKKNTTEEHEDFSVIHEALDAMGDVAKYINEYKRDTEVVSEIKQIHGTLKFDMPVFGNTIGTNKDYGRHIKDGELQVQFENSDKKEKRFSFLFEHALLLCKSSRDSNEVKESLDLGNFKLEDVQSIGKGNFSHCFALRSYVEDGVSDMKNCKIFTKTEQFKKLWTTAITKCIQTMTLSEFDGKLDNHVFSLTTFHQERYEKCGICKKLLTGLISQGYLCTNRRCQLRAHLNCLSDCPPCQQQPRSPNRSPNCSPKVHKSSRAVSQVINRKVKNTRDPIRAKTLDGKMPIDLKRASLHKQKSLDTYNWFGGVLTRDQAGEMLRGLSDGAFLIRESEKGGLVISIQYNDNSLHIKITEQSNQMFLTDSKPFPSVDELITYYESNTLGDSFPAVPTVLTQLIRKPVKRNMIAIHNWEAKNPKELTLKIGDTVSVLQDDGNWWVGIASDGRQGYFPSNYVK